VEYAVLISAAPLQLAYFTDNVWLANCDSPQTMHADELLQLMPCAVFKHGD